MADPRRPRAADLRADAERWAVDQLALIGLHSTGTLEDLSIQAWSAVWRLPTSQGPVILKQTTPAHASELTVHSLCARLAPEFVDAPLALDIGNSRMLLPDGGPTLLDLKRDSAAVAAGVLEDYIVLQQATIDHRTEALAAGLPAWDPRAAPAELEWQAETLHALPASDLRHITTQQRDQLLGRLDVFQIAGDRLARSGIPCCLDHGDLWPGNVLGPVGGRPNRFIDFGDAAWTHPFLSLPAFLHYHHRCWTRTGVPFDVDDHLLRPLIDSYLRAWTAYRDQSELKIIFEAATRIAPLRRSRAAIDNFEHAGAEDADDLGPTPWEWLTAGWRSSLR